MSSPGMQQSVGKDMATFAVSAELNFIDHHTIHIPFKRHRLHRAAEITGIRRNQFFLTCNQRDLRQTQASDQLVIILTRQQPQRKASHARGISQHPVHRIKGLACIGRAQNTFHKG